MTVMTFLPFLMTADLSTDTCDVLVSTRRKEVIAFKKKHRDDRQYRVWSGILPAVPKRMVYGTIEKKLKLHRRTGGS